MDISVIHLKKYQYLTRIADQLEVSDFDQLDYLERKLRENDEEGLKSIDEIYDKYRRNDSNRE